MIIEPTGKKTESMVLKAVDFGASPEGSEKGSDDVPGDMEQGGGSLVQASKNRSSLGKPPLPTTSGVDKVYVPNRLSGTFKPRTIKYLGLDKKKKHKKKEEEAP